MTKPQFHENYFTRVRTFDLLGKNCNTEKYCSKSLMTLGLKT